VRGFGTGKLRTITVDIAMNVDGTKNRSQRIGPWTLPHSKGTLGTRCVLEHAFEYDMITVVRCFMSTFKIHRFRCDETERERWESGGRSSAFLSSWDVRSRAGWYSAESLVGDLRLRRKYCIRTGTDSNSSVVLLPFSYMRIRETSRVYLTNWGSSTCTVHGLWDDPNTVPCKTGKIYPSTNTSS